MTKETVGEVIVDSVIPANLKNDIRKEFGKGIDAQFAIGNLLIEAHVLMPDDRVYGRWVAEQNFPFRKGTAFLLQRGAEREDEVRAFIAARVQENERDIGVPYAMQLLDKPADDRQPKDRVKALQDLLGDEPETSTFVKFRAAAEALDVSQLATEELVELAGIIQSLVGAYNVEKAARKARVSEG